MNRKTKKRIATVGQHHMTSLAPCAGGGSSRWRMRRIELLDQRDQHQREADRQRRGRDRRRQAEHRHRPPGGHVGEAEAVEDEERQAARRAAEARSGRGRSGRAAAAGWRGCRCEKWPWRCSVRSAASIDDPDEQRLGHLVRPDDRVAAVAADRAGEDDGDQDDEQAGGDRALDQAQHVQGAWQSWQARSPVQTAVAMMREDSRG